MSWSMRGFVAGSPEDVETFHLPWLMPTNTTARDWENEGVELLGVKCEGVYQPEPVAIIHVSSWSGRDHSIRGEAAMRAVLHALSAHTGGIGAGWVSEGPSRPGLGLAVLAGADIEDRAADASWWADQLESSAGVFPAHLDAARISGTFRRRVFLPAEIPIEPPRALRRTWLFARASDLPPAPEGCTLVERMTPPRRMDFDVTSFPFVVLDGCPADDVDAIVSAACCDAVAIALPERIGARWLKGARGPDVLLPDAAAVLGLLHGLAVTLETWPHALR